MKNIGWALVKIAVVLFCVAVWYVIAMLIYYLATR
jgi:hypothetical protein